MSLADARSRRCDDGARQRSTVAVHDGDDRHRDLAGPPRRAYGIAFDVGSTTVAGHLCDLFTGEVLASAGEMNPQIRFGEDLMSRVSYVMLNPGSEKELTRAVRGCLAKLDRRARDRPRTSTATTSSRSRSSATRSCTTSCSGSTRRQLGGAPFALAVDEAVRLPARELGLPVHRGRARVRAARASPVTSAPTPRA